MLKIFIAIVLIAHGIGHSMGVLAAWTTVPSGLSGQPWLFANGTTMDSPMGKVLSLIWLAAVVATVGAGVGLLVDQPWWEPLAVISAVLSLAAILPSVNTMPTGSAIGAIAVDVILLVALLTPWAPPLTRALR